MRCASGFIGLTGVLFFASNVARAQVPAKLEFDVATVKPAAPLTGRPAPRGGPGTASPERVNYTYLSMKNLLMTAYSLPVNQVLGPPWIDSERYDIVAKVPAGATKEQVNVMLQNLLATRFKLTVRLETRELPIYELVMAKNGSKLKPYVEDPNAPKPEPGKPFATGKDGVPIPPPGTLMMTMSAGRRRVTASKQTISRLAEMLGAELGRPVADKTGLAGEYDYSVEFRPQGPNAVPPGQQLPPPADFDAPDLVVALQEQLGLKLEPKKGPVDVVVVEQGEKTPTEN
jgi:uncharacterized protein (TIGR03435 family)